MHSILSILLIPLFLEQLSPLHSYDIRQTTKINCEETYCGAVIITYPFGTNLLCSKDTNFLITCNKSSPKPKAILTKFNLEVLDVNTRWPYSDGGHITVTTPTVVNACDDGGGKAVQRSSLNLSGSPFFFDTAGNVFATTGYDGDAWLYDDQGGVVAGCRSTCRKDLRSVTPLKGYSVEAVSRGKGRIGSCWSGFLTSRTFLVTNVSLTMATTDFVVPVVLAWGFDHSSYSLFDSYDSLAAKILPVSVTGALLISACCFWLCWLCKTRKRRRDIKLREKYFKGKLKEQQQSSTEEILEKTKLFSVKELKRATNNFSTDRVLGRGGQGTVYKGMLTNGQVIAVKMSKSFDESQWKQLINEVIVLSQITHRNVVKLLGCCLETRSPLLIYEFITNGTLSQHIHGDVDEVLISWESRVRIACETAGAIAYLHSSSSTPIYHRDIKSTNILLDDKYEAKVSDFGVSKAVLIDQTHLTTCVRGTFGYLDPEYFESGQFSEKSDVYSFGVVLVELLTGQRPIRVNAGDEEMSLVDYFLLLMNESCLDEVLDPRVLEGGTKEEVMVVANLAKGCLNSKGIERPTMHEVVMELERLRKGSSSMEGKFQEQTSFEIDRFVTRSAPLMGDAYASPNMHKFINITHSDCDDEYPLFHTTW